MEDEKIINNLLNDMKETRKLLDRSKKFKQELIDLLKEKSKKKIPDEIVIHMDFQVW